jgi:ankyrin repeat protein
MADPRDDVSSEQLAELAAQVFDLARTGETDQLAACVDRGVPVDLADWSGNTLLMLAAYHGRADTVRSLVDRGADVDKLNDRGQSPLAGAIFKGESAVVEVLIAAGADPDAGTPTARAAAQLFGSPELFGDGS